MSGAHQLINYNKSSRRLFTGRAKDKSAPAGSGEETAVFIWCMCLHQSPEKRSFWLPTPLRRAEWLILTEMPRTFQNTMGEQEQLRRKTAPSWPLSQHVLMVIDCWTLKLHGWPHHISVYLQGGAKNSTVKSMSSALCRLLLASISFNCRTGIQWAETVPQMLLLFNNTPAAAFAQLGAQRCRPCEECLCLGHIWRFFCGFQGLRLPFSGSLWSQTASSLQFTK